MASDHATLVDSNVLLDVLTEDADWLEWSENALATALDRGPDIGAHAAVAGHDFLTRDSRRYRTYFPRVALIAPD